jgi:hypothetical protein
MTTALRLLMSDKVSVHCLKAKLTFDFTRLLALLELQAKSCDSRLSLSHAFGPKFKCPDVKLELWLYLRQKHDSDQVLGHSFLLEAPVERGVA